MIRSRHLTYLAVFVGAIAVVTLANARTSPQRCRWETPTDPWCFVVLGPSDGPPPESWPCSATVEGTVFSLVPTDLVPQRLLFGSLPYGRIYDDVIEDYRRLAFDMEDLPANRAKGFRNVAYRTNYIQGIHLMMMGLLAVLPEDVTNWADEDKNPRGAIQRWKENVRSGPVVDSDDGFLNWILHPWMGGGYYVLARKSGMTRWESFGFSVFASTCLWEYGFESIAEEPSSQDLWITPLFGSILGEVAMREEARVKRNGGRVWGSRVLGDFWLWMLNPFWRMTTSLARQINRTFHVSFRTEFFREVQVFPMQFDEDPAFHERLGHFERVYGVRIKAPF